MSSTNTGRAFLALAALGALVPSVNAAALHKREPDPPQALEQSAALQDLKWQPVLDFDTDSCYNVPAIGPDGRISEGLPYVGATNTGGCRDEADLDNSNVYSRKRCNSGWCAYMYDYYWEKDTPGHRHDIEHVVVWVQDDQIKWVSTSMHGKYTTLAADDDDVYYEGDHVKVVYHKDGGQTHALRHANGDDADNPENDKDEWIQGALVSWDKWPEGNELRDKLMSYDWGVPSFGIKDGAFAEELEKAIPKETRTSCTGTTRPGGTSCADIDTPRFEFDYAEDNSPSDTPTGTVSMMIVGDSITQGEEGDYTWRFRLWEWLTGSTDQAFTFVGPYLGTKPLAQPLEPQPPRFVGEEPPREMEPPISGSYNHEVSPDFFIHSNHFAVWGRQLNQDVPEIQERVRVAQPDMMLVMLGFNDMGWYASDAQGTLQSMEAFISEARKGKNNIKFAIADVPERSFLGAFRQDLVDNTREYNKALPDLLNRLSNEISPITLVNIADNYACHPDYCPAGYDGLHPNAWGEYQIAREFTRALIDGYGIGDEALTVPPKDDPRLQRDVSIPGNIVAQPSPMGVTVTWDPVYGVPSYGVRNRIAGQSDWQEGFAGANRWDQTLTVEGIDWEFQIRSEYGDAEQGGRYGEWSSTVSATARRDTPPAPNDINAFPTDNGIRVNWGNVEGDWNIDRYGVILYDLDTPGSYIINYGATGNTFTLDGLERGHRYACWVETWEGPGHGGLAEGGPTVLVGGGIPGTPTNVRSVTKDPTTAQISWSPVDGAAAYRVYVNGDDAAGNSVDGEGTMTENTSIEFGFMFPGTWHFTICVTAINGGFESDWRCTVPPKADGF